MDMTGGTVKVYVGGTEAVDVAIGTVTIIEAGSTELVESE